MKAECYSKAAIREAMRRRRRSLSPEERSQASAAICRQLIKASDGWSGGDPSARQVVAAYLATRDEIDLSAAIAEFMSRGITVVVPRWDGVTYQLARLYGLNADALQTGPMGVSEPKVAELVPPEAVTTWLVPGLAFTRDGLRLGYGGGWYDRLLAGANAQARKLGVALPFQVLPSLPVESHDIRLDAIVECEI